MRGNQMLNSEPDATLIANCQSWIAQWDLAQSAGVFAHDSVKERQTRAAICNTPAVTQAGLTAKAEVVARLDYDCRELVLSLCNDLRLVQPNSR